MGVEKIGKLKTALLGEHKKAGLVEDQVVIFLLFNFFVFFFVSRGNPPQFVVLHQTKKIAKPSVLLSWTSQKGF